MRPWQRKAGFQSQTADVLPFLQLFFHVELPFLSHPVNIPPISPGSAQTHSPMNPSWTHLFLFPNVLFISLISHEVPVLFWSIICIHAHDVSQLLEGKICGGPQCYLSLILTTSCTGNTGPISQMRKLRLSEVTSVLWGMPLHNILCIEYLYKYKLK